MKITIDCNPKEAAALIAELQERQGFIDRPLSEILAQLGIHREESNHDKPHTGRKKWVQGRGWCRD